MNPGQIHADEGYALNRFLLILIALIPGVTEAASESWSRWPGSERVEYGVWETVPHIEVPHSMSRIAITALREEEMVRLEASQLGYYLRQEVRELPSGIPVLLRALYINPGIGSFRVQVDQNDVWVSHASFGREVAPERTAVVAFLESVPERVFVSASVLE